MLVFYRFFISNNQLTNEYLDTPENASSNQSRSPVVFSHFLSGVCCLFSNLDYAFITQLCSNQPNSVFGEGDLNDVLVNTQNKLLLISSYKRKQEIKKYFGDLKIWGREGMPT